MDELPIIQSLLMTCSRVKWWNILRTHKISFVDPPLCLITQTRVKLEFPKPKMDFFFLWNSLLLLVVCKIINSSSSDLMFEYTIKTKLFSLYNYARQWNYKRNSQSAKNGCKVKSKAVVIIPQKVCISSHDLTTECFRWRF